MKLMASRQNNITQLVRRFNPTTLHSLKISALQQEKDLPRKEGKEKHAGNLLRELHSGNSFCMVSRRYSEGVFP